MADKHMEVEFDEEGKIIDFLSSNKLEDKPEERVRQAFLKILHYEYKYRKEVMRREVPIYYGRNPIVDESGQPKKADIVVYEDDTARATADQGRIRLLVENKAPEEESGHHQLVSYIFNTSANGAIWHNGTETRYYRRLSVPEERLIPWPGIPGCGEAWDAVGRQSKRELVIPGDIKGLLKRCHNKLHRRGTSGDDITMDMVRILIAKCRDEEKASDTPEFYCTPEEYLTAEGRRLVAERVENLFEEFRDLNPLVFDTHETINVGNDQVVDVVTELQHYRLISDDENQWDIMGAAYEEYTADELKRAGGEFFTNRLVIGLLVHMVEPTPDDLILDVAGGTGGFCTATLRYLRGQIRNSRASRGVKRRLLEQIVSKIFYIEIKYRLVKIAKTAMLLTGDGHQGCIQGDSLMPVNILEASFVEKCPPGRVTRVLTNPPFAGLANGRITDPEVLKQFELGKKWVWQDGRFVPTCELSGAGIPPETLFIERCWEWLAPGGILGIVQPKGFLDTTDPHLASRHFIFRKFRVLAVITCHKNTFQPYTGSRTALLLLQKKENDSDYLDDEDYEIFMAISKKIGQDSEGNPIYKMDDEGNKTEELDHDLYEIYDAWLQFKDGDLEQSEYVFSIKKSQIDQERLFINPQRYLPSLNESLRQVLQLGDQDGWSITTVGETASRVYKGERFKREDLETEETEGTEIKAYFTPGAILQGRGESVKYLDLSRASDRRKKTLLKHALERGQILITRSGSIGRVTCVMGAQSGHIGSDDLIRLEIEDETLRYYVYGFLKTKLGQDQMYINEYGTIQQHLEPMHIRDIVIPIPDDMRIVKKISDKIKKSFEAREKSYDLEDKAVNDINRFFD